MHDRTGWERGEIGAVVIKGKRYPKLVPFTRPCATCGQNFSIFVTEKIADGHADSNSFGLKNCEDHRRNRTAADNTELDMLRTANKTMSEELTAAYTQIRELQNRLNKYELQPAMAEIASSLGNWPGGVIDNPFTKTV
jgi:hypothetical protein